MKKAQFERWFELAELLSNPDARASAERMSRIRPLYEACFTSYMGENETGFSVTSPTYRLVDATADETQVAPRQRDNPGPQAPPPDARPAARRTAAAVFDLKFSDYQVTSGIESLVGLISLERAREESDERLLKSTIKRQLGETADDVRGYVERLGNEEATLLAVYTDLKAQKLVNDYLDREADRVVSGKPVGKDSPSPPPKADSRLSIELTVIQTIILEAAARELAAGMATTKSDGSSDAQAVAAKTRFTAEADTYLDVLSYVRKVKGRLTVLEAGLRREDLRKAIGDYLVPIARHYDGRRAVVALAPRLILYSLSAVIGVTTFLIVANIRWPYFGQPGGAALFAVIIAMGLGMRATVGPLNAAALARQRERLRNYLETVRLNRERSEDFLEIMDGRLAVGKRPPADTDKHPTPVPPGFEFRRAGAVAANPLLQAAMAVVVAGVAALACAVPGVLPPAVAAYLVANDISEATPVQALRRVAGRELCEVVEGDVAWQDGEQVYAVVRPARGSGGPTWSIAAIARSDATELRFGPAMIEVEPCATQAVQTSEFSIANIPVTITTEAGDGTSSSTTTLDVRSNLFIDGEQVTLLPPPELDKRLLIVPLSQISVEEVTTFDAERAGYFGRIFDFYLDKNPVLIEENWILPIREALLASVEAGCAIEIEAFGYASDMRFPQENEWSNYYLAEGRRAYVLEKLGFTNGSSEVRLEGKEGVLRLVGGTGQRPLNGAFMPFTPSFGSYDEMIEHLGKWYSEPSEATERLQESLVRSVIISISQKSIASCPLPRDSATVAERSSGVPG